MLSRRKADEAVSEGHVTINGSIAAAGDKVFPGDEVCYKGKVVEAASQKRVILAYNKPLGLVCTSKDADKDSIFRHIDYPDMLYYVGRLDKNSQGLILLTNDGDLANSIQKARNGHEKEYIVRVDKPLTAAFVKGMMSGVPLEIESKSSSAMGDIKSSVRVTKKCRVKQIGKNTFSIVLTEGINRQIRRMCEYFGFKVVFLKRVRVMNIMIGDLETGKYRKLTANEELELRKQVSL